MNLLSQVRAWIDRLSHIIGWHPSRATLVATVMVIGGFMLTDVSWWFIVLSGLGAVGPGILREMGWLRDKDEFARRSAERAGYHAFLATALAGFVIAGYTRSGQRHLKNPEELATLFLALLWFTWLLSSLLAYWGARKASLRILLGFGVCWLLFCLADSWQHPLGALMHSLPAWPFFLLAWLSRRWPRVAGALLILVGAFMYVFFRFWTNERGGLVTQTCTAVLLVGPLLGSGLALLRGEAKEG
jgi:hypothetical protein